MARVWWPERRSDELWCGANGRLPDGLHITSRSPCVRAQEILDTGAPEDGCGFRTGLTGLVW
jgi:hypothetical protein